MECDEVKTESSTVESETHQEMQTHRSTCNSVSLRCFDDTYIIFLSGPTRRGLDAIVCLHVRQTEYGIGWILILVQYANGDFHQLPGPLPRLQHQRDKAPRRYAWCMVFSHLFIIIFMREVKQW